MALHNKDMLLERLDQMAQRPNEIRVADDPIVGLLRSMAGRCGRGEMSIAALETVLEDVIERAGHTASSAAVVILREMVRTVALRENGTHAETDLRAVLMTITERTAEPSAVTTEAPATHSIDGHSYPIDEHRIIREEGPFKDQPVYAPYFWNSHLDGSYDDEYWEHGQHVIVFNVTEDDLRDYPELAGATKVFIREDPRGALHTRLDRQE